jgi:hypothetical protein
MKKSYIAAAIIACTAFSTIAFAKDAKCKVVLDGKTEFYGTCNFKSLGNDGSFTLSNKNPRKLLLPDIKELWVRMEQKNVAELASVEPNDHFQRWGVTLIRSTRDRACWENSNGDISICAY